MDRAHPVPCLSRQHWRPGSEAGWRRLEEMFGQQQLSGSSMVGAPCWALTHMQRSSYSVPTPVCLHPRPCPRLLIFIQTLGQLSSPSASAHEFTHILHSGSFSFFTWDMTGCTTRGSAQGRTFPHRYVEDTPEWRSDAIAVCFYLTPACLAEPHTLSWAFSSCCLVAGLTEGLVWGWRSGLLREWWRAGAQDACSCSTSSLLAASVLCVLSYWCPPFTVDCALRWACSISGLGLCRTQLSSQSGPDLRSLGTPWLGILGLWGQ